MAKKKKDKIYEAKFKVWFSDLKGIRLKLVDSEILPRIQNILKRRRITTLSQLLNQTYNKLRLGISKDKNDFMDYIMEYLCHISDQNAEGKSLKRVDYKYLDT